MYHVCLIWHIDVIHLGNEATGWDICNTKTRYCIIIWIRNKQRAMLIKSNRVPQNKGPFLKGRHPSSPFAIVPANAEAPHSTSLKVELNQSKGFNKNERAIPMRKLFPYQHPFICIQFITEAPLAQYGTACVDVIAQHQGGRWHSTL